MMKSAAWPTFWITLAAGVLLFGGFYLLTLQLTALMFLGVLIVAAGFVAAVMLSKQHVHGEREE